ncbi:MAG: RIP metalloprotease RseP [Spirochaetes bacterium]|nr:RIP metalloprotease RseP [Spirochaetota bacterium]MBU0956136.1 RIP metalloprotease RseP [Spirochaetota bacterium]
MTLITILLGLIGLGLVVFVHELGHFLMARLFGVEVEEFSLGWGPKIWGFKRGATVYRLSAFPVGGYCRMKGEDSYRKAIEEKLTDFPREPGTYFAAHPLKRIIISLGGPIFNVIFAFLVFFIIMAFGYSVQTFSNRIILAEEFSAQAAPLPASRAGLQSGDFIEAIDGRTIASFSDLQEAIALSAGKLITLSVRRGTSSLNLQLTPELDTASGAGRIGIYPWIEPRIAAVPADGAAFIAGVKPGDLITAVDGQPVQHTMDISRYLGEKTPAKLVLSLLRDGQELVVNVVPSYQDNAISLGVLWQTSTQLIKSPTVFHAIGDGFNETASTISSTFKGLISLFQGVNPLTALSGPARITWIVGQVTTDSFESGVQNGLASSFNFLAILSIGLFIMNLLPIPVLDGGWIVLFVIELIRRKPVQVKTVFRYQLIGLFVILALFLLTTVGDILFFSGK